ncbi:MAG: hemolysin family protein [Lachnospiraceae bacterium]|nr:hemolysin family protein [Lachnospiraceae bacterium]
MNASFDQFFYEIRFMVIFFIISMIINGLFTAYLAALSELSQDDEDALDERRASVKDHPEKLICTGLVLLVPVDFSFVFCLFRSIAAFPISHSVVFDIPILIAIFIVWGIIGIMFPFYLGRFHHLKFAEKLYSIWHILSVVLTPFVFTINLFSGLLAGLFGVRRNPADDNVTEDEILAIVNEGQESGTIEESEARMINNIFELSETEASSIQVPRNKIAAFEDTVKLKDALKDILNSSYSRYPVYHEDIDHIIGILHIKDAVRLLEQNPKRNPALADIKESLLETFFVPETKSIDDLFREMQSSNMQMVIVTDEYGQTSGIISMEDILEEIVGSIRDEYDREREMITGDGEVYEIDGFTRLDDLNERFGIDFGECEFETINGYLTDRMGHIPDDNEYFETDIDGYHFEVLEASDKIIKLVGLSPSKIQKNTGAGASEEADE